MRVCVVLLLCGLAAACSGGDDGPSTSPVVPAPDAAVDAGGADAGDGGATSGPWTNQQKCDRMCQAYCVHKLSCDGTPPIDQCRMTIDERNGGTCQDRAGLFRSVPQSKVQACIDAIAAMGCPAFERLYVDGKGVPEPCKGILS